MSDLISREALLKACDEAKSWWIYPSDVLTIIENQPIAYDVEKVVLALEQLQEDGIPTRSAIRFVKGGGELKQ